MVCVLQWLCVVERVCVCLMSSGVCCSVGTPVIVLWLTVCSAVISISLSLWLFSQELISVLHCRATSYMEKTGKRCCDVEIGASLLLPKLCLARRILNLGLRMKPVCKTDHGEMLRILYKI